MDTISIYYQNVRSIRGKLSELYLASLNCDYDVIVFVETWLSVDFADTEILNDNYIIYRNDRHSCNSSKLIGGGVLIAVAKRLHSTCVYRSSNSELLCVSINTANNHASLNMYLYAVYLPSPASPTVLESLLEDLNVTICDLRDDNVIVLGDFNLPNLLWAPVNAFGHYTPASLQYVNCNLGCELVDFMSLNNLTQFNLISNNKDKILDLVLSNMSKIKVLHEDFPLTKIDHYHPPLMIDIDCQPTKFIKTKLYSKPNFNKGNYADIECRINAIEWNTVLDPNSTVDQMVNIFQAKINSIIDGCVPKKI